MRLLRLWRVRLLGGAAIAVVTPVAILAAAVTVGFAGGGYRALGSLGQALTGPPVPEMEPGAATRRGGDPRRLLERSMSRPRGRRSPAAPGAPRERASAPGRVRSPAGQDTPSAPGPSLRPPSPSPPPERPPKDPERSPVREVGDRTKTITDRLPVAGRPAGEVVDTIVDTVEALPMPPGPGG